MFQEIVSQISFSPAMVERLSLYAHTIKRRQRISGWSLIVVGILCIAQIIVTMVPPPSDISQESLDQSSDTFVSPLYDESSVTSTPSILSQLDTLASNLPSYDNAIIIGIYSLLLIVNILTYLSLRLRAKEIRIIRTQLNTGGL